MTSRGPFQPQPFCDSVDFTVYMHILMTTDSVFLLGGERSWGYMWAQWRSRKAAGLAHGKNGLTAAGNEPAERPTWEPRPDAKVSFSIHGYELHNTEE